MLSLLSYTFMVSALLAARFGFASPIEKRAVDAETFDNLKLFGQFAAAAYCPSNNDDGNGGKKVTCPPGPSQNSGNCPLVEADNVTTVLEFQNSLVTDVTGYLAVDATRELIILSFRGSSSVRNWITNFAFRPVDAPTICGTCSVNRGFYVSWQEAKPGVLDALALTQAAYPGYRVVVTGHSLGGAIAAIAAADIRNQGTDADLYSYGAPRIGMEMVSGFITNQNRGGNFRVTHANDPVPKLPPRRLGWRHISPEYWIRSGNEVEVDRQDVDVLHGTANGEGNAESDGADVDAHSWYFNDIAACDDGADENEF